MLQQPSRSFAVALVLLAATAAASAQPTALADLLKCLAVGDSAARLACFDREAKRLADAPAPAPAPVAAAPGATPAPRAAASPAAADPEAAFGLVVRTEDTGPAKIVSTLPAGFDGWRANDRIRLANGQVWRIADDSAAYVNIKSLRVEVRRGALGAFYMDFDGDRRSPRVRRVE